MHGINKPYFVSWGFYKIDALLLDKKRAIYKERRAYFQVETRKEGVNYPI